MSMGQATVDEGRESTMSTSLAAWLESYEAEHRDALRRDPEFARWLATDYTPIAGGWQF